MHKPMTTYHGNAIVNYPDAELNVPPVECHNLHSIMHWVELIVNLHEAQSFVITIVKSKDVQ